MSIRKTQFYVAEMLHTGEYMKFNIKYSQRTHPMSHWLRIIIHPTLDRFFSTSVCRHVSCFYA